MISFQFWPISFWPVSFCAWSNGFVLLPPSFWLFRLSRISIQSSSSFPSARLSALEETWLWKMRFWRLTFYILTFNIFTFNIFTFNILTFNILTFNILTFNILKFIWDFIIVKVSVSMLKISNQSERWYCLYVKMCSYIENLGIIHFNWIYSNGIYFIPTSPTITLLLQLCVNIYSDFASGY